jgi:plasmid maintenance system antidote protein VapI
LFIFVFTMNKILKTIKGIHPGFFLDRELKKRKIPKGKLAIKIGEYPQTLVAITKGKRRLNTPLAMKLEKELGFEMGFFTLLQAYHDIDEERKHTDPKPDIKKIRKIVFWDTDIDTIDWIKMKKSVIRRVIERGNETERAEIIRFYGEEEVVKILKEYES